MSAALPPAMGRLIDFLGELGLRWGRARAASTAISNGRASICRNDRVGLSVAKRGRVRWSVSSGA
jgi:hypothetical protein